MAVDGYFTKNYWFDTYYWWPDTNGYWQEAGEAGVVYTRIEARVFDKLQKTAAVTAICSTRIYPSLAVQNPTFPMVVYQAQGGNLLYSLGGYSTLENPYFSINCYASNYSGAKNLANAVINAMEAASQYSAIMIGDTDIYDDDKEVYGVNVQFSVWHPG